MLSDAIRQGRRQLADYSHTGLVMADEGVAAVIETLRVWEAEARNMEERLTGLAGREHVPLAPAVIDDISNVVFFPPRERPFR